MADTPLGLLFRINADPSQAQSAIETFRSRTSEQMQSLRSDFASVQQSQSAWCSDFLAQTSAVDAALETLGEAGTMAFDRLSMALGRNI
jgi:hypothetical protein